MLRVPRVPVRGVQVRAEQPGRSVTDWSGDMGDTFTRP